MTDRWQALYSPWKIQRQRFKVRGWDGLYFLMAIARFALGPFDCSPVWIRAKGSGWPRCRGSCPAKKVSATTPGREAAPWWCCGKGMGSDAWLEVARALGGPWRMFGLLRLIPKILRDAVYRYVARNRYLIFGKSDHCSLPDPAVVARLRE
jgi:hypothetical protein